MLKKFLKRSIKKMSEKNNLQPLALKIQLPIMVSIVLVYIATILLQDFSAITKESFSGFTIIMMLHAVLYYYQKAWFKKWPMVYFALQGIVVFDSAVIMPQGYVAIFTGLLPILIAQSIMVLKKKRYIILTITFYYVVFCVVVVILNGYGYLKQAFLVLVLITVAVWVFNRMYNNQVSLRHQYQQTALELERTNEKVEILSRRNERQQIARDLHDTLSQGLVGLLMQLEAVSFNLEVGNVEKANTIIEKSLAHGRDTLDQARIVIQDLRDEQSERTFKEVFLIELKNFRVLFKGQIIYNFKVNIVLTDLVQRQSVFIIRELLSNIIKHAKASNVTIEILDMNQVLHLTIRDDGIGFNIKDLERQYNHYGIMGINERVKMMDGTIIINSIKKQGTNIKIEVPLEEILI